MIAMLKLASEKNIKVSFPNLANMHIQLIPINLA